MLVLTRRVGEEVCASNGITVKVVNVKGKQVRLSFTAPDHVKILRKELLITELFGKQVVNQK